MKKILFSLFAAGLMLTSCNMDKDQPGTTLASESVQSVGDVAQFRNNLYGQIRALTSGSYVVGTDMQTEFFVGLRGNGGRGSTWTQSNINPSTSEIDSPYAGCYGAIGTCNFLLQKTDELIASGTVTDEDMVAINRYLGETYFMRAYFYWYLFDHYCQAYTAEKANQPALGLQLVTEYNPQVPFSEYPGRSTMAQTVARINADLEEAYNRLTEYELTDLSNVAPNAPYISSYVVKALQARMALLTRDWPTAIARANEIIGDRVYALTNINQYAALWTADQGTELMFVPFVNASESGSVSSFFNPFNYINAFPSRVNCVPTMNILDLYEGSDCRFNAFYSGLIMTVEAQTTAGYIFNKYPGNPALNTSQSNSYKNKPKPFRLSEIYLILAEASYENNDPTTANEALRTLRSNRIRNYRHTDLSGDALRDAIRNERNKELIGEGFHFSDMRRWGLGFQRSPYYGQLQAGTVDIATLFNNADLQTIFQPNDYRYVWPIPRNQFETCPAMAGQQNPGY
jgi:hypothetical protein